MGGEDRQVALSNRRDDFCHSVRRYRDLRAVNDLSGVAMPCMGWLAELRKRCDLQGVAMPSSCWSRSSIRGRTRSLSRREGDEKGNGPFTILRCRGTCFRCVVVSGSHECCWSRSPRCRGTFSVVPMKRTPRSCGRRGGVSAPCIDAGRDLRGVTIPVLWRRHVAILGHRVAV